MFKPVCRAPLLLLSICACLMAGGCNDAPKPARSTGNMNLTDDTLVKYNREIVKSESQEIDDFISRYHWNMQTSSTGLRYMIYEKGSGGKACKGQVAVINYTLKLLNGQSVYSSEVSGPREFTIGAGSVENGLEEGVLLLHTGDHAKLIVPSHLAFGLLGDLKQIPERAVLVYDIELVQTKRGSGDKKSVQKLQ